jgi:hypothetical protein
MKPGLYHIAVVTLLLLLPACQENNPVELAQYPIAEPVEVILPRESDTTVVHNDTTVIQETTVDLTGLIQQDDDSYPGTVLVTDVKSDVGGARTRLAYSRILLRDVRDSLQVKGNFGSYTGYGYRYLEVGKARLDNTEFDVVEWIIQIKSLTLLPITLRAGFFYKLGYDGLQVGKPITYMPNHEYVVSAEGKGQIGAFGLTIDSPDEVTLLNPRPQGLVFRDEDLVIRWAGRPGDSVQVIISTYDEARGRALKPLMVLRASPRTNSLVFPSKLLKLIPTNAEGRFMLTLVSANRKIATLNGYPDRVLLQAASIHNLLISLR